MGGVGNGRRRGRHDVNIILTNEILKKLSSDKKTHTEIVRDIINFKDSFLKDKAF